jgi:hypothetical protein
MDGHVALKHHVAGKDLGQRDFGVGGCGEEKDEAEAKVHDGTFIPIPRAVKEEYAKKSRGTGCRASALYIQWMLIQSNV